MGGARWHDDDERLDRRLGVKVNLWEELLVAILVFLLTTLVYAGILPFGRFLSLFLPGIFHPD